MTFYDFCNPQYLLEVPAGFFIEIWFHPILLKMVFLLKNPFGQGFWHAYWIHGGH